MGIDCIEPMTDKAAKESTIDQLAKKVRRDHRKFRYHYFYFTAISQAFHQVVTVHFANTRFEVATGYILMAAARFQYGLFTYYTLSFHVADRVAGVGNKPLAAE